MAKDLVRIGKVIKPHGLKGELRVHVPPDSPFLVQRFERVYMEMAKMNPRPFAVDGCRSGSKGLILALDGLSGRDEAEKWRGAQVLVREKDLVAKVPDSFLTLLGYAVYEDDGGYVGVLENAWNSGGGIIWTIFDNGENEILFPAEPQFVTRVDQANKRIYIDPPPGLLGLYGDEE